MQEICKTDSQKEYTLKGCDARLEMLKYLAKCCMGDGVNVPLQQNYTLALLSQYACCYMNFLTLRIVGNMHFSEIIYCDI